MIAKPKLHDVERTLGKKPPADIDAEMGVIGSAMLELSVMDDLVSIVRAEDFHDPAHQILFRHLLSMFESGKRFDLVLLSNRLNAANENEKVGGLANIQTIFESVPHHAHVKYYAEIVLAKSVQRSLINAGASIIRDAYEPSADFRKLVGDAEQRILGIMHSRGGNEAANIRDVISRAMERIGARVDGGHVQKGVSTGLEALDKLTGGLQNSELIVLAGRPSMGKTALAMNIVEAVGVRQSKPTLFVSLEMSQLELADRMLCSMSGINGHHIRNGSLSPNELDRLIETASMFNTSPLFIDDSSTRTVSEVAAAARRVRRREGALALIVIDYLQLLEPDNPRDPRQEQVARMTRRLKALARELNLPVLVLAQLNRQAEATNNNRPRLSHLRESGAIEQDADVVMFVHREEYYRQGEEKKQYAGQAEIIISKQRNGPIGDVRVSWESEFTRFVTAPPQEFPVFVGPFS